MITVLAFLIAIPLAAFALLFWGVAAAGLILCAHAVACRASLRRSARRGVRDFDARLREHGLAQREERP